MTRIGVGLQVPADGQVLQMNVANTVGVALDEAYGVDPGTKQVGGVRAEQKYLALVHYGHDLGLVLDLTPEVGMQARLDAEIHATTGHLVHRPRRPSQTCRCGRASSPRLRVIPGPITTTSPPHMVTSLATSE